MGKSVIFDFDGTIADSAPAILATLQQVLAMHAIQPKRAIAHDLVGPPLASTLTTLTGITDHRQLDLLITAFKAHYDSVGLQSTLLYEGMAAVVTGLASQGYRLLLATNKRQLPTDILLARFGLRQSFAGIYCLDSRTPPYADKSTMLSALLATESLTAADCLYIGDTCHDEEAAAKAGIAFMAVAWGYGVGSQLVSPQATLVTTPAALSTAIDRFFAT